MTQIAKPTENYLFVYGTLRRACTTGAHHQYLGGATFISPAKIRGQLFSVDYYPGLVIHDASKLSVSNENEWVIGEVYLLRSETQLHQLDEYEGCASHSPQPHEYQRRCVEVLLSSGEKVSVWTYIYQQSTQGFTLIESGDFLQQTQQHTV